MKPRKANLTGTALAMLTALAPSGTLAVEEHRSSPPILAQSESEAPTEEELLKKQQEAPAEQAPAEQPPAEQAPTEQAPAEQVPAEQAPAEQAPPEQAPAEKPPAEQAPAEQAPTEQAPAEQAPPEQAPAEQAPPEQAPAEKPPAEQAPAEQAPTEQAPAEQAPPEQAPAEKPPAEQAPAEQPPVEQAPAEQAPAEQAPPEQAPAETPPAEQVPPEQAPAERPPATEGRAPILDSQKQPPPAIGSQPAASEAPTQLAPAETAPPPVDDGAAQIEAVPQSVQPVNQERGRRIEALPETAVRQRPARAEVLREMGDRTIVQFDDQVIVQSNERPRMTRGARDVYYEELPRGRTRETIVRRDGSRVVTIRDRYGDVIRRSRIAPDDREYVLVYVDEGNYDRVGEWRDPGLDLPPMRLAIPEEEYILDSARVDDPDVYYTFLDQPPVERVERLYSIDEVKRSARIRDKTRRVDLDTITFEFGSASIADNEIQRLEGVAAAMEKILRNNPAETFLIEGHTDAVGSDVANLALSDRRAETVADALTTVFAIPPENLATQGYGEQYLKIDTTGPERVNRRVAIRRITPLVAPIASEK